VEYENLHNYKELHEYIASKLIKNKMNYIFIDEVQKCEDFEKAVDSLYVKKNTDVYITGSNAYMLSRRTCNLAQRKVHRNKNVTFVF
jgi:predicted AAA+ superfamily ATPase